MPLKQRIRPRIGDVIEIPTPRGLAYANFTHKHEKYGALIRVLPGLHETRPSDFAALVAQLPQFMAFFPTGSACSRCVVQVVAHEDIPQHSRNFPTFRSSIRTSMRRGPWWLWDGSSEWQVGHLEPGMEQWPIQGVWNDTLLVERIVSGWRHELDT